MGMQMSLVSYGRWLLFLDPTVSQHVGIPHHSYFQSLFAVDPSFWVYQSHIQATLFAERVRFFFFFFPLKVE
jgi:hypothetical protein